MLFKKKKIGLALCGGAARALCHVGVLKELDQLDLNYTAISGTSMGAIIGAFYCSGVPLEEIEDFIRDMDWRSMLMFSDITMARMGIINGKKVEKILHDFLGNRTFSQCRPQFCCVAVDMLTQKKVVLHEGRLVDAVRASISIPGVFSPVKLDDMVLVDGGVIEPLPAKAIKMFDVDFTIGVSIVLDKLKDSSNYYQSLAQYDPEPKIKKFFRKLFRHKNPSRLSTYEILNTSFNIIQREMAKKYYQYTDLVIEPKVGEYGFFDFIKGSDIVEKGCIAAREKLPELKQKLKLR
ncbi:MAG: patatin-like phospholipase family protein [Actinomycetota bacterium]|jgi:NTE family protein|nr:patatin-like phospholipase family protein [Actinomycetota bacterium]